MPDKQEQEGGNVSKPDSLNQSSDESFIASDPSLTQSTPIADRTRTKKQTTKPQKELSAEKLFKPSEQINPILDLDHESKIIVTGFSGRPPSIASSKRQALHSIAYSAYESMIINAIHKQDPETAFYRMIALSDLLLGNQKTNSIIGQGREGIDISFLSGWKNTINKRLALLDIPDIDESLIKDSIKEQKRKILPTIINGIKSILTQKNMEYGTAFAIEGNIPSAVDEGPKIKTAKEELKKVSTTITALTNIFDNFTADQSSKSKESLLERITKSRSENDSAKSTAPDLYFKLYDKTIEEVRKIYPKSKSEFVKILQDIVESELMDSLTEQILNIIHYPYIDHTIDDTTIRDLIDRNEYRGKESFRTNDVGSLLIQISGLLGVIYESYPELKGIEGSSARNPMYKKITKTVSEKIIKDQGWLQAVKDWYKISLDADQVDDIMAIEYFCKSVYGIFNSSDKYHGLFDDVNKSAEFSSDTGSDGPESFDKNKSQSPINATDQEAEMLEGEFGEMLLEELRLENLSDQELTDELLKRAKKYNKTIQDFLQETITKQNNQSRNLQ